PEAIRLPLGALDAELRRDPRRVGDRVDSLHRSDHPELREPWDVGGRDVLRMLDAPAQRRAVGYACRRALVHVEHFAVGAVADRVRRELESVLERERRYLLQARWLFERQARAARQVGVRLEQPGAVRA